MKCMVNGCENHEGEGEGHRVTIQGFKFDGGWGWICSPCILYITATPFAKHVLWNNRHDYICGRNPMDNVRDDGPPWEFEQES